MKDLLTTQTEDAFQRNGEMSLLCSLSGLTQAEAEWKLNATTWSIGEILYHVGSCKLEYCRQAFGGGETVPEPTGQIDDLIAYVSEAHRRVLRALQEGSETDLTRPVPTAFHGESAAHLFWILIMHDISHGAQIRTIRRAYGSRTDYYPVR